MKKKLFDSSLHGTRGTKDHTKFGLSGRVVTGEGFSKRAGKHFRYRNFNESGKSNIIEWL